MFAQPRPANVSGANDDSHTVSWPDILIVSVIALPIFYFIYSRTSKSKVSLSILKYVLSAIVLGLVTFVIGTMLGIAAACLPANADSLCALMGLFGSGPLVAGLALLAFGYLRIQAARTSTKSFKRDTP